MRQIYIFLFSSIITFVCISSLSAQNPATPPGGASKVESPEIDSPDTAPETAPETAPPAPKTEKPENWQPFPKRRGKNYRLK